MNAQETHLYEPIGELVQHVRSLENWIACLYCEASSEFDQ